MTVRPGIELANLTDPGCVRERNEDYYCYFEPDDDDAFRARGRLLVVADGMGGHEGGQIASGIAVEMVRQTWSSGAGDPSELLFAALSKAHAAIQDYAREHPELAGMGTTCTAAALIGGMLYYGHVGDTRLYLIRGGAIVDRTLDHSRVHHLVSAGLIRPEDAKDHPERNRIFNCLGAFVAPSVEVSHPTALHGGDILLLCSDGLWGNLNDRGIIDALSGRTVMRAVPEMVDAALELGGIDADNCTALAMAWAGAESMDMVPPTDAPVSTLVVPEGAMTSTVQIPRAGDEPGPAYTDDQIDDAVNEIQKAIQRASKLIPDR